MVIGPEPDRPTFHWCVGQGGTGIQSAPGAGQLVADLPLLGSRAGVRQHSARPRPRRPHPGTAPLSEADSRRTGQPSAVDLDLTERDVLVDRGLLGETERALTDDVVLNLVGLHRRSMPPEWRSAPRRSPGSGASSAASMPLAPAIAAWVAFDRRAISEPMILAIEPSGPG